MNRYKVNSLVGEGSFGMVYKAVRKDDNQIVAIKVISKRGRSSREFKNLRRECDIQAQLKHPNVIEMLESFETKHELVVVTEFALIDLHRYMARNGPLTEEKGQRLICDLISALYYLHSNRILHRDLKPQNVLLDEDLHAKLCDFGLARNMTMSTHVLTSIKGTPLYMAPELLAEKPYDHLADLWSLGCIAYESMAGQPPFYTTSILHLVKLIKYEEVKWPSFLSSDCRSFLQGLLEKDPSLRTSWAQILCHPFVEGKLYIRAGIKAENSPFINPQLHKTKSKKSTTKENSFITQLTKNLRTINLNETQDNLASSRDSINAIPPSDIEQLETDCEDNGNRISVPFTEQSYSGGGDTKKTTNNHFISEALNIPTINSQTCYVSGNNNMIINHLNDNFAFNDAIPNTTNQNKMPIINSQTCFVSGNMILNHLNDNFAFNDAIPNTTNQNKIKTVSSAVNAVNKSRNKDLEKRKLSQNLDNFSLRLGHNAETDNQKKSVDKLAQSRKEQENQVKDSKNTVKTPMQSGEEKQSTDNSPPCLLPGWDSCDESQSPPIENEEWLAFLHRSMQEVLEGELESLKQQNLVSIIVAPLRNSKAIPTVVDSVGQLLSLPFVLNIPPSIIEIIKTVYIDVKLVPNLMYACKLLIYHRPIDGSTASLPLSPNVQNKIRTVNELDNEEIKCAFRLYELISHLVHIKQQFLTQFCDAVAILAADELLINFLNQDFKNEYALRIANSILALLSCVLRERPENAELVEKIIFSPKVDLISVLRQTNNMLRLRMCMLLRLLGRFSLRALQKSWSSSVKQAIEDLTEDANLEVKEEAENTLNELRQFSFYS